MKELKFFGDELAARYGRKLQRIPIDLAFGCPNRENRYGAGCVFCAENGSRARHLTRNLDLAGQVARGVEYVRDRYRSEGPYIAYFQSFTSTFAPVERLRECFEEVLSRADFKVVIVGTRPDALEPEKVEYLRELAECYELWVELGVQSANDETLLRIRRGHDFSCVKDAVRRLDAAKINCACHVILGLPGEGMTDYLETARALAELPFRAVKLHQLLVLKHTELAGRYQDDLPVKPLNEYEYAAAAAAFLRELPDHWSIMRLTADAEESEILAPRWWMDKGQFRQFFAERFRAGAEGGDYYGVETADGSRTLYHPEFRQLFHSLAGAESEARHKFIGPAGLAAKKNSSLLDIGFGLGVNALEALRTAAASGNQIEIESFELDERPLRAALEIAPPDSEAAAMLRSLLESREFVHPGGRIRLHIGDARAMLPACPGEFDAVFLDAFSPDCNPELWTLDFLAEIKHHCRRETVLATYSSAHAVRGALLKLGFAVGESRPFGRKRGGTVASLAPELVELPLGEKERGIILRSTAGTPYRDRSGQASREEILACREKLVRRLRDRGVPKWYKVGAERASAERRVQGHAALAQSPEGAEPSGGV